MFDGSYTATGMISATLIPRLSQMFQNPRGCRPAGTVQSLIQRLSQNSSIFVMFNGQTMLNTLKSLFTVLVIVLSSCAAHADQAAVAYTDDSGHANSGKQASSLVLNSNTYEIQQQTSKMVFRVDSPIGDVWASFQDFEGVFTMLNSANDNGLATIEINAEMGLLIDSAKMITENHSDSDAKLNAVAYRVLLNDDGDLEWHGLVNGEKVIKTTEPDTSAWLRFKAWFMKIAPESQL